MEFNVGEEFLLVDPQYIGERHPAFDKLQGKIGTVIEVDKLLLVGRHEACIIVKVDDVDPELWYVDKESGIVFVSVDESAVQEAIQSILSSSRKGSP